MATITMDTSEYEALQKNIKLLEESRERESELHKEIQKLKDEALQELLDNSKKVSIVKQTTKVETIHIKKDINDIFRYMEKLFSRYYNGNLIGMSDNDKVKYCIEAFFYIQSKTTVEDQTVTTKGFDEVKEEFEKLYKENLDKDIQTRLDKIPKLEDTIKELHNKNLNVELIEDNLERYKDEYVRSHEEHMKTVEQFSLYKSNLRVILSKTWNIFNYGNIKQEIKSLGLY